MWINKVKKNVVKKLLNAEKAFKSFKKRAFVVLEKYEREKKFK